MNRRDLDALLEQGLTLLVGAMLVFAVLATGAVRAVDFLVVQGLTMLALILWAARFWTARNHRLLWPPVCWAVLAFLAYAAVRSLTADLEYVARDEWVHVMVYLALFFLILNNLHRQETTQMIAFFLVVLGTAVSMYAIYQYITNADRVWNLPRPRQYIERGSGTYMCPNHLAGFLGMVMPLGLGYLFAGRFNHTVKVFLGYACLVMMAGIAVTLSRGGWLATACAMVLFFGLLLRRRHYRIPAIAALVVVVAGVTLAYNRSEQIQDRLQKIREGGSDAFISARPAIWKAAYAMWKDHFWFGVGPGHFDYRFHDYRPPEIQVRPGWVHNDYLNTLVDWGVVGGAIVAVFLGLLVFGILKTRQFVDRQSKDLGSRRHSNRAAFMLGAGTGLFAMGVHSFLDFNMHIPANAMIALALTALACGHLRFTTHRYWISSWKGYRMLATLFILGGVFFLGIQGWRKAQGVYWLRKADDAGAAFNQRIVALENAARAEPTRFETLYQIGEGLRERGWLGRPGYEKDLETAIGWFKRAIALYPDGPYNYLGTGLCLDQLGRVEDATPFFDRALGLDPKNHYIINYVGWHRLKEGDISAAKALFQKSLEIKWWDNHTPLNYLRLIEARQMTERGGP